MKMMLLVNDLRAKTHFLLQKTANTKSTPRIISEEKVLKIDFLVTKQSAYQLFLITELLGTSTSIGVAIYILDLF